MRSAMMRQTLLTPAASAGRASGAVAAFAAPTSAARMAPPGPEPRTILRSTPRSAARRRALGDAVAGRLDPAQDLAGLLRHLQRRHDDVRWHRARGFYRSSRP